MDFILTSITPTIPTVQSGITATLIIKGADEMVWGVMPQQPITAEIEQLRHVPMETTTPLEIPFEAIRIRETM